MIDQKVFRDCGMVGYFQSDVEHCKYCKKVDSLHGADGKCPANAPKWDWDSTLKCYINVVPPAKGGQGEKL